MAKRNKLELWEELEEDKLIAKQIFTLASQGATRDKIRKTLSISVMLWQTMLQKADIYPRYTNALLKGEMIGCENIVESLKTRARGYEYEEVTIDEIRGKKTVTKHVPADVNAIKYYLNNTDKLHWAEKRVVESTITTKTEEIDYSNLSSSALKELLDANEKSKAIDTTGKVITNGK